MAKPSKNTIDADKVEVPGLRPLAAFAMLGDAIMALAKLREQALRHAVIAYYLDEAGQASHITSFDDFKKKTFDAVDGEAHTRVTLKRKGAASSGLKPEVAKLLTDAGLVLSTTKPGLAISSKYVADSAVQAKLTLLLKANPDHGLPADFFTPVEAKPIVAADTIMKILGMKDRKLAAALLMEVCELAVPQPVLTGEDALRRAFDGATLEALLSGDFVPGERGGADAEAAKSILQNAMAAFGDGADTPAELVPETREGTAGTGASETPADAPARKTRARGKPALTVVAA